MWYVIHIYTNKVLASSVTNAGLRRKLRRLIIKDGYGHEELIVDYKPRD